MNLRESASWETPRLGSGGILPNPGLVSRWEAARAASALRLRPQDPGYAGDGDLHLLGDLPMLQPFGPQRLHLLVI